MDFGSFSFKSVDLFASISQEKNIHQSCPLEYLPCIIEMQLVHLLAQMGCRYTHITPLHSWKLWCIFNWKVWILLGCPVKSCNFGHFCLSETVFIVKKWPIEKDCYSTYRYIQEAINMMMWIFYSNSFPGCFEHLSPHCSLHKIEL